MINGSFTSPRTVYYSVAAPSRSGPRPLLIAFHGFGQTSPSFARLFEPMSGQGILVAAPQAPNHFYVDLPRRIVGFTWLTRYELDRAIADNVAYLESFYQRLRDEFEIDEDRVSFLGFSQGASVAYRLWMRGRVPCRSIFACGSDLPPDVESGLAAKDPIPVRLLHGDRDELVPISKSRDAYEALHAAGFDVECETFPTGHSVSRAMIEYVADHILGGTAR